MFETDVVDWDPAKTLAAVVDACTAENEAGVRRLILAVHFADLHPSPAMIPGHTSIPGRDRSMIYGGPGCPGVSEFAVAEYAVVRGVSPETAAKDIGQALSLRHRHPLIWSAVMNRTATPWKARLIATECINLSIDAAAIVDRRIHDIVDTTSAQQLKNIVKAAKWEADPEAAHAEAVRKARERGVWTGRSDEHGTTTMFIKAATGAVIRLKATINQLADALAVLGDTDSLQTRQAKTIDILSNPALADKLLKVAQYLATHPQAAQASADATTDNSAASPSTAPTTAEPDQNRREDTAAGQSAQPTNATGAARPASTTPTTDPDQNRGEDPTAPITSAQADQPADNSGASHPSTAASPTSAAPAPISPEQGSGENLARAADAQVNQPADSTDAARLTSTTPAAQADQSTDIRSAARPSTAPAADPACTTEPATESSASDDDADAEPEPEVTRDGELASDLFLADEPSNTTEADRDAPHPSDPSHPFDPPPAATRVSTSTDQPDIAELATGGAAARHNLAITLAAIKQAADNDTTNTLGSGMRPSKTKLYIHLTDETLIAGGGTTRVEGFGPVFAANLAELLGHDRIVVQPVIDLNQHLNTNAYEIPQRIRERIKLTYPVEQFPYGPGETTNSTDLDHIDPYIRGGPPGQTNTRNLQPLGRFSHRVKTHAPGWSVRRIDDHTIEWITLHGYTVHVDHNGTHPAPKSTPPDDPTANPTANPRHPH